MLAGVQGSHRSGRVMMIGHSHHDRIDLVAFLLDQLAIIAIQASIFKLARSNIQVVLVDIAQGHDVLMHDFFNVVVCAIGSADTGEVQFLVG